MRRPLRRHALLGLSLVLLLGASTGLTHPTLTEASWTDREAIGSTLTAGTVPTPTVSPCTTTNGALGINKVTLNWRIPAGATAYTKDNVEFGQRIGQGATTVIPTNRLTTIATSGTAAAYSTAISGMPIGGKLGEKKTISVRLVVGTNWKSGWVDACTFDVVRSRILNSQITVTASSEEGTTHARFGPLVAKAMNDDNPHTAWHSRDRSGTPATYPHTIDFDLGSAQSIDGLSYLSGAYHWTMGAFTIETSTDGRSYAAAASGTWRPESASSWQDVNFAARSARYVRITTTSSVTGDPWAAAVEIAIFGTPVP